MIAASDTVTHQGAGQIQDPFANPPSTGGSPTSAGQFPSPSSGGYGAPQPPQTRYAPIVGMGDGRVASYYENSQLPYAGVPPVSKTIQYGGVAGVWNQNQPQLQQYSAIPQSAPYSSDTLSSGTDLTSASGQSHLLVPSPQHPTGVYSGHPEV